ncbi:MAG TPA: SCP2 sterol-binding domain-containing protein [Solirubrobacteraceae bacterium]|nr:SCP2 sterol-binding domain-containing protein [Solirubrobacteraceae bacterium]
MDRGAFATFVARSDDRRLDRVGGSRIAQRLVFHGLARRFNPAAAGGFTGELQFDLRRADGRVDTWTVLVAEDRARPRRGAADDPALIISADVSDVARMAAGELGPTSALLTRRLDLAGDWGVAMRLGRMFGAPD